MCRTNGVTCHRMTDISRFRLPVFHLKTISWSKNHPPLFPWMVFQRWFFSDGQPARHPASNLAGWNPAEEWCLFVPRQKRPIAALAGCVRLVFTGDGRPVDRSQVSLIVPRAICVGWPLSELLTLYARLRPSSKEQKHCYTYVSPAVSGRHVTAQVSRHLAVSDGCQPPVVTRVLVLVSAECYIR